MKITINKQKDATTYFVTAEDQLDFLPEKVAEYALGTLDFSGKLNEIFSSLGPQTENVIVVGLGDQDELTKDHYVQAAYTTSNTLNDNKVTAASVQVAAAESITEKEAVEGITEGFLQSDYSFDKYRSEKTTKSLKEVSLLTELEEVEASIDEMIHLVQSVNITRDLVNTPANDLYPASLADKTNELFEGTEVEVEIYDQSDLEKLGAHALLAVSKGSVKEPRMIVLKYLPLGKEEPVISLVGKG